MPPQVFFALNVFGTLARLAAIRAVRPRKGRILALKKVTR
jgi:hypothetical protein